MIAKGFQYKSLRDLMEKPRKRGQPAGPGGNRQFQGPATSRLTDVRAIRLLTGVSLQPPRCHIDVVTRTRPHRADSRSPHHGHHEALPAPAPGAHSARAAPKVHDCFQTGSLQGMQALGSVRRGWDPALLRRAGTTPAHDAVN